MARRRIEGYWTCSYCGTKGIGGLTKTCPNCGHPQSKGLKFELDSGSKKYLEPEIAENYGKGADWVCSYCGSYNRYNDESCKNCGAEKVEAEGDYFGNSITEQSSSPCNKEESGDDFYQHNNDTVQNTNYNNYDVDKSSSNTKLSFMRNISLKAVLGILGGTTAIIAIIMLLISIFTPKMYDVELSNKSWDRIITIQELRTFDENDWDVPAGGRVYDERQEIRDYDHVIDHYDIEEHQVPRKEIDHYDYKYYDNGDGTFDEEEIPVYTTVYDIEYEEVPVYVDVPIYDTKYYYKIDKWCYNRTESSSGETDDPYWPEFNLSAKERESGRNETYTIYFETKEKKTYSKNVSYDEWKEFNLGEKYHITVVAGIVTEIEP